MVEGVAVVGLTQDSLRICIWMDPRMSSSIQTVGRSGQRLSTLSCQITSLYAFYFSPSHPQRPESQTPWETGVPLQPVIILYSSRGPRGSGAEVFLPHIFSRRERWMDSPLRFPLRRFTAAPCSVCLPTGWGTCWLTLPGTQSSQPQGLPAAAAQGPWAVVLVDQDTSLIDKSTFSVWCVVEFAALSFPKLPNPCSFPLWFQESCYSVNLIYIYIFIFLYFFPSPVLFRWFKN